MSHVSHRAAPRPPIMFIIHVPAAAGGVRGAAGPLRAARAARAAPAGRGAHAPRGAGGKRTGGGRGSARVRTGLARRGRTDRQTDRQFGRKTHSEQLEAVARLIYGDTTVRLGGTIRPAQRGPTGRRPPPPPSVFGPRAPDWSLVGGRGCARHNNTEPSCTHIQQ